MTIAVDLGRKATKQTNKSSANSILWTILQAKSRDPDQAPRSVASGLGLHCLPMSHKKDEMLI